jgi:hypothetical protein
MGKQGSAMGKQGSAMGKQGSAMGRQGSAMGRARAAVDVALGERRMPQWRGGPMPSPVMDEGGES